MDLKTNCLRVCVDSIYLSVNSDSRRNILNIAKKSSALYRRVEVVS
jgi:hypothetical protein